MNKGGERSVPIAKDQRPQTSVNDALAPRAGDIATRAASTGALSLFDLLCLGVNAIVGSGIYAFPGILAALLGPASFLAFAVCGLTSLLVAFCFAEAAGMFDRSGGPYVYAKAAFGGPVGYLVGWTCWAAAVMSGAAVARALIPYLGHLWAPLGAGATGTMTVVLIISVLGAINVLGVKPGAYTTDVLTVAKLLPLCVLAIVGLFSFDRRRLRPFAPRGFGALPHATFIAFFAFQGFEVVPVPAGESTNPRRNVPLAIIGSLIGTTLLYVVIQIVAVATTPQLAGAKEPLALMGETLLGHAGGQLVAGAAVISMLGFCAGVALASPRYIEALALDGFLPTAIAQRHSRYGTPHRAIVLTTVVTATMVVLLDFSHLVDLSVITVAVQYISTCVAVPILRRRRHSREQRFTLPFGPLLPLLSTVVVLALVIMQLSRHRTGGHELLTLCVLIAVGAAAALLWRVARRQP